MRLLELYLKAFGPFTGRRLDLSGGHQGLHLILGPNEAGKSSALRALKVLLYGFPPRSGDDFLHSYDRLRVGARLRFADGSEVEVLRRKGNRTTLLAADDRTPLDEALLEPCLKGIDEALFSSLFGLDHDALVDGGKELLAQKGDIGQALFAAGLGTRNLRQVLRGFDAEADALFLPRGSRPRINRGIAEHREARRSLAALSLSSREWDDKRRELEKVRSASAGLERQLSECKVERHRLQRIRRAQPRLAERRDLLRGREQLGDVLLLRPDFGDSRRETEEAIRVAAEAVTRLTAEVDALRQEAAALTVAQAVLDQADNIDRLHQGVQLYVKDRADRSRLLGEHGEALAAAESLLIDIRPGMTVEEAEARRPALGRWLRIQTLGHQRQALWNDAAQARRETADAEQALAAARGAGEAPWSSAVPRDPALLRAALDAARAAGDLDGVIAGAAATLGREEEQLRLEIGCLGLWQGSPEALEALPVPGEETLRRFQEDLERLLQRRGAMGDQLGTLRTDLADAERRLEELRRGRAVPTEEELTAARTRRDHGWDLLRGAGPGAVDLSHLPDIAAYERSVREADDIADRLRHDAGRVQEQAQLLAHGAKLRLAAEDLEAAAARAAAEQESLEQAWRALWHPCGIDPLPPREMHSVWVRRHEQLRSRAADLRADRRRVEALRAARAEHRAAIQRALEALGAPTASPVTPPDEAPLGPLQPLLPLAPLLIWGEQQLRAVEREQAERAQLAAARRAAEDRLATARAAAATAGDAQDLWQREWGEAVAELGLDRSTLPGEAAQIVDLLHRALAGSRDAAKLSRRIAGIDRDLELFAASVGALAAQLSPDLGGRPPEQAAVQLQALLSEARRRSDRRLALERRSEKLEQELRTAASTETAQQRRLAALLEEAGCAEASGIEEAERRSAQLRDLLRELERGERQLVEDGDGRTLADLEAEAGTIAADLLPSRIDQLDREIEALEARSLDLRQEIGKAQQELDQMTGGDGAARQAERVQEVLAALQEDVLNYTRVRLAAVVLRREIERYRAQNQDPLLRRAAQHFATLTVNRYTGLQTDFDDRDQPVLAGVRPDGRRVRVEAMSEGTRDQIYLALRLATLERYLLHAEPLPFIVDDILVNFDDERSAATLKVLAQLSAKTQVILFTHHAHLRDLAAGLEKGQNGAGAGIFLRELA